MPPSSRWGPESVALPHGTFRELGAKGVLSAIVERPGPDINPESILRDADIAMYRAKFTGRGRVVVFDVSMRQAARAVYPPD